MFELKPDFEDVLDRFEAWWNCAVTDRPLVGMTYPVPEDERRAVPRKEHATIRDRWMDAEYVALSAEARLRNRVHAADALPVVFPNLGPEVFSAFYGCEMEYGEHTVWSKPVLRDWSREAVDALQLDMDNFYFKKVLEVTDAMLEVGKDTFMVGYTDLHGGGDALAAFRDPQELLVDTIENPEAVKALCDRITTDFMNMYDLYYDKLSAAGMPSTTWTPATCKGKFHIPSNDFSCMISEAAFEELFIPGLIRECEHMDRSLYHLDGGGELKEWTTPKLTNNWKHRHIAHIYPLLPGVEAYIDEGDAAVREGCRIVLDGKVRYGTEGNGFVWSYMSNAYARLGDAEKALEALRGNALNCDSMNLFSLIVGELGTILIDGNGGFSSTVLEMLLYSQPGKLKVLPALPDSWPKGKAEGMLARGGLTVDLQWDMQERVVDMNITSKTAQTLELYFPSNVKRSTVTNAQCEPSSRGANYLNATVPAGKQVALRVEFE